ncbi:MAG TPA: hypothetical protein VJ160_00515 [Anaerolineales bacterium]|nr:hypothetical protein [Anaerolineales bacterium]
MANLILFLRIVHIVGGVFWAGGAFIMAWFVEPAVRAAGDDGRRFMQRLGATGRFSSAMAAAAGATVLAGLWLLWIFSSGFLSSFFGTGRGLALGLGMFLGIAAFVVGFVMQNRPMRLMAGIGRTVAAAGAPPTPSQAAEMEKLTGTVRQGGRIVAGLLLVTVILMATARYLPSF